MGEAVTAALSAGSGAKFQYDAPPHIASQLKQDKVRRNENKVEMGEDTFVHNKQRTQQE